MRKSPSAFFSAPILFFLFSEKEKNRRGVRRSQLHSVSAGAAKTPYPQPSSSFPNCDRFTGSQFGHLEFYNAARYLDDGGHFSAYGYGKNRDFHTPQVQSKALVDGEGAGGTIRKVPPRFSFLFFTGRGGSFLSQRRERKEWGACWADRVVRPYKQLLYVP